MAASTDPRRSPALSVFAAFLRLGCTSFGGPLAHLGYFHAAFVTRRRWLDEAAYADVVALCQFLPGPASSQVGLTIGMMRAGLAGGLAAWLGFTLPSAVLMIGFAYGIGHVHTPGQAGWLHGLRLVAVAVVAQAVWGMARNLCPDRLRASMAVGAALVALSLPSAWGQVAAILAGGLLGWWLIAAPEATAGHVPVMVLPRRLALLSLAAFFALLAGLPLLASGDGHTLALIDRFFRAGALVFGGGHVVLPLLQQSVVPPGWIGPDAFLAGYGVAQAMPGPLFSFAAFLGAAMLPAPRGWLGGLICLAAIYLPSFLLLLGILPFWDSLRRRVGVQSALRGVNATVVGLLLAALYTPVWISSVSTPRDFSIALLAFLLLALWKLPPWLVVVLGAAAGAAAG